MSSATIPPYRSIAALGHRIAPVAASHLDRAFRHILRGPQVVSDRCMVRLITGAPHPYGNFALMSDGAAPQAIDTAIGPLVRCGAPAAVLFTSPVASAVDSRLKHAGFAPQPGLPAMAVQIETLAPAALPAGYSLDRVGSGGEADDWTQAFARGYELPLAVARAFSPNVIGATHAAGAPLQFFGIRRAGRIVCTSAIYLDDGIAGVYCVSTVPEERGRGLGGHATAEPLRLAHALGYRVGVLQSSAAGHALYRQLGFTDFGEVPLYVRAPT